MAQVAFFLKAAIFSAASSAFRFAIASADTRRKQSTRDRRMEDERWRGSHSKHEGMGSKNGVPVEHQHLKAKGYFAVVLRNKPERLQCKGAVSYRHCQPYHTLSSHGC